MLTTRSTSSSCRMSTRWHAPAGVQCRRTEPGAIPCRPSASQPRDRHPLTDQAPPAAGRRPPASRSGLQAVGDPPHRPPRPTALTHGPRLDVAVASRFPNLLDQPSYCTRSQPTTAHQSGVVWPSRQRARAGQPRSSSAAHLPAVTGTPGPIPFAPLHPLPSRRLRGIVRGSLPNRRS